MTRDSHRTGEVRDDLKDAFESASGGAVLCDPPLDGALAPDAAGREFADGLGEGGGAGELVGSLLADCEPRGDLGYSHQFHLRRSYLLTASTVKWYRPLGIIKRPRVALTTGAAT